MRTQIPIFSMPDELATSLAHFANEYSYSFLVFDRDNEEGEIMVPNDFEYVAKTCWQVFLARTIPTKRYMSIDDVYPLKTNWCAIRMGRMYEDDSHRKTLCLSTITAIFSAKKPGATSPLQQFIKKFRKAHCHGVYVLLENKCDKVLYQDILYTDGVKQFKDNGGILREFVNGAVEFECVI